MASDIKIDLDVALGTKSLNDFNKELSKTVKLSDEVDSNLNNNKKTGIFDDMTKSLIKANISLSVITEGFSRLSDFISSSIEASIDAENSINSLRGALIGTNEATQENIDSFTEYASNLQSLTKFEDDLILSQIALAKNFGLTNEESKKLVRSATEVATVLNTDLNSAVEILLKSLEGQGKGLKLLGKEFTSLTEEQLKSGRAIDLVIEKFGGQALNATKTYGGSLVQLKNNFNDLQETIGRFVTENSLVNSSIGIANKAIGALNFGFELLTGSTKKNIDNLPTLIAQYEQVKKKFGESSNQAFLLQKEILSLANVSSRKIEIGLGFDSSSQDFKNQFRQTQNELSKEAISKNKETNESILKEREKLRKELENAGLSELQILNKQRQERIKKAGEDKELLLKIEADYQAKLKNLKQKSTKEEKSSGVSLLTEQLKLSEKISQSIPEIVNAPIKALFVATNTELELLNSKKKIEEQIAGAKKISDKQGLETLNKQLDLINKTASDIAKLKSSAVGIGLAGEVLKGASGAKSVISAGVQVGATALGLPPQLAQSLGPIVEALFGGPEAVRGLVKMFAEAIPELISNLILAVPAVIDEVILQLPRIIDATISQLPFVIQSLANSMPTVALHLALSMPMVAISFSQSLISNIPLIVKGFIDGLADGLKEILGKINPFGGGGSGGGGGVGGILQRLKFAEGGQAFAKGVPTGFQNDSFPAMLTSGELVVDRSTAYKLKNFLNNPQMENNNSNTDALLVKVIDLLNKPMNIVSDVNLNNRTFANIILELNRTNQRLA